MQSLKIILTTQSENIMVIFLQDIVEETLSNRFVPRDEQLTWSDNPKFTEKSLEIVVNFEGSEIVLNYLVSADTPVINSLPIADRLGGKLLTINEITLSIFKNTY
jgi:hypothetical protein